MATDATNEGTVTEATTGEEQDWGKITLAVLISVVAALTVHYVLIANIEMHATLHALVGIVLFFVAGIVMFKIVLF